MMEYSSTDRRQWIRANSRRYEREGFSLRQIAREVQELFGLPKAPSPATIESDLAESSL